MTTTFSGTMEGILPRFECKYMVDSRLVPEIRRFIRPFVVPDPHAAFVGLPLPVYTISSLYLDSPDLRLYGQTVAGEKRRFKLRIRSYGDDLNAPVFPEIKRRENVVLQKVRAAVDRWRVRSLLDGRYEEAVAGLSDACRDALEEFQYHSCLVGAQPVIRVRYSREAWIAETGEPLRITFDSELAHAVTLDDDLSCTAGDWHSTPMSGTILEIKFTERFPFWVHDLIAIFGLDKRSVPKYVMCIDRALRRGRGAALAVAGFTLPPGASLPRSPGGRSALLGADVEES